MERNHIENQSVTVIDYVVSDVCASQITAKDNTEFHELIRISET